MNSGRFFMPGYKFNKQERLKSRNSIIEVFQNGKSCYSFPVKILYTRVTKSPDSKFPVKCGFSVSKRNFRNAVERNLLKRRMREAYRLHKAEMIRMVETQHTGLNLFILYVSDENQQFKVIEEGIKIALDKLISELKSA
jgi:ribonuclease P protein component